MADYKIILARSARKELEALDGNFINRIFPKIEALANAPYPAGCRKLKSGKVLWRIRVGDYRIVYAVYNDKKIIDIIAVRHRKDAYE